MAAGKCRYQRNSRQSPPTCSFYLKSGPQRLLAPGAAPRTAPDVRGRHSVMFLFALTSVADFLGMCTTLWLAGYLFSRGFRSPTTVRAVLILLLLAGSFYEG